MAKYYSRSRLVVFDNDDTLCNTLDVILAAAGLNPEDFTDYHTELNPEIGLAGMRRLEQAFLREDLYGLIEYDPSVKRMDEIVKLGAPVYIESNTVSQKIGEIRRQQLLSHIPALQAESIHMNVITQEQSLQKVIPKNTFIFVDDSPYNVAISTAEINIMRARRWNITKKARRMVASKRVIWLPDLDKIIDMICELLLLRIREDELRAQDVSMNTNRPYLFG